MAGKQPRAIMLNTTRATSTITMRAIGGYPGSQIFLDPYYACYDAEYNLKQMGKEVDYDGPDEDWHQAGTMIMGQDCTGKLDVQKIKYPNVKKALENPRADASLVFCKNISISLDGNYEYLPDKSAGYRYAILLRDPIKVYVSYRKALYASMVQVAKHTNEKVVSWEEFNYIKDAPPKYIVKGYMYKELYDLYKHAKKNLDPNVVVIDSDDLLNDPDGMMRKFCAALGLPFSESMLKWSGKLEDCEDWWFPYKPILHFDWLKIYLKASLTSTEFKPPFKAPSLDEVTDDIRESVEFVKPYFDEMYAARIMP